MDNLHFKVDWSIDDSTGKMRAMNLGVRTGDAAETREIVPGKVFADYREDGKLIGVEFLSPCGAEVLDSVTIGEPGPVQQFVRQAAPRELQPC